MNLHEYQAKQLLSQFGVAVPKGLPRFTVMLESVAAEFPKLGAAELEIAVSKYKPGWARIKGACKPSPHFRSTPIAVA